MINTLSRHEEIFSDIPGKTNVIKHKIELTENNPVRSRLYPLPYAMRENLKILAGMSNVDSYIDDLLIHTNDWQAHIQVLEELLRRLWKAGLTAKPSKCLFGAKSVEFLGHYVGRDWITINEDNLEKIRTARRPTTKKEIRSS